MKTYIGIDNGVSGAIGMISPDETTWAPMPIRKELNYTKAKKWINRVNTKVLMSILRMVPDVNHCVAWIERPMVNPSRFQATLSAIRCLEATLIALENCGIPYQYIDSREWQKTQLPSGLEKEELKTASLGVGRRLWPNLHFKPDADALLIARHCSQKYP